MIRILRLAITMTLWIQEGISLRCSKQDLIQSQSKSLDLLGLIGIRCSTSFGCTGWDSDSLTSLNTAPFLDEFLMGGNYLKLKTSEKMERYVEATPEILKNYQMQATQNGFDKEVTLTTDGGKEITKYFKVMTDSVNARVAAARCLEVGGVLPRAYSADQLPGLMSNLGLTGNIPIGLFKYPRYHEADKTDVVFTDSLGQTLGFGSDVDLLQEFNGCKNSFTAASYGSNLVYGLFHGKSIMCLIY